MKRTFRKLLAVCLCGALAAGGVGLAARRTPLAETDAEPEASPAPLAASVPAVTGTGTTVPKDETVYILTGADGAVENIIVSDWLKNAGGVGTIRDETSLTDVENVKGGETYTTSGGALLWDAQGNDIYYQGSTDRDPPVEVRVSYTLDGKQVTPEKLAGKSGRVTIRFDYTNRQRVPVEVNGKQEELFVPFAVLTGVVLDNEVFTNVEVTGGRLVNDGDRTVVVGMAFPGLQEDLALDGDVLEIPGFVEISADAEIFALDMTLTLATSQPFRELDTDRLGSIDELGDSMDQLTEAMDQLLDGSSQLSDGLDTLLEQSGALVEGIGALRSGAAELSGGLDALTANNDALNGGARQVFETLLATADTQLAAAGLELPALTVDSYAAVLDGAIASLDGNAAYEQALAAVTAAVEEQRSSIQEKVTAAVREQVAEQVVAAAVRMDKATYDAAVAAGKVDAAAQAAVEAAIGQQMESEEIQAAIAANTEEQVQKAISDNMASDEVQAKLAQASEGAQALISLKASLDSYNTFYQGLRSYTAGVAQASAGADTLKAGTEELNAAVPALTDGVTQLRDGAVQLRDGLREFNEEGIQKLADAFEGDLEGLSARIRAVKEAAGQFTTFAGTEAGADDQVKFIYRTEGVG